MVVTVAVAMDDSCSVADTDCEADSIETYAVAEKLENRKDDGTSDSGCRADCVSIAGDVANTEQGDGDTVISMTSVLTVCDGDTVSVKTVVASKVEDIIVGTVEYSADFVGVAVISIPVDLISVTKPSDIVDIGGVVTTVTDSVKKSLIDCVSETIVFGSGADVTVETPETHGVVSA